MDLVQRKKLLLRKYNTNAFSNEQIDFFTKINASEIVILLKQNAHLRTCAVFFQHVNIRQVQKVIASIFQPEEAFIRSDIFNILINVLRDNTMLLDICFANDDFNYMSIFGFLEEEHVEYPILILLEDVLLPIVRKTPHKLMDIFSNDDHLEYILLSRIYQKPVFKLMYTVVFCLSKKNSEQHHHDIKKIVHQLINTPFTYLFHKQKRSEEKIVVISHDRTQLKEEKKGGLFESNHDLKTIQSKKVREKKQNTNSEGSIEESINSNNIDSPMVRKVKSPTNSSKKNSVNSKKSRAQLHSQVYNDIQSPVQFSTPMKSQPGNLEIQLMPVSRFIPLNQDLDYGDLTYNLKELFSDISFNIRSVYLKNVASLVQNFNEEYIDKLLQYCERFLSDENYEGYCEGAIEILLEFVELYRALKNYSEHMLNCSTGTFFLENKEYQGGISQLMLKLQKQLKIISSKIPFLCRCLMENTEMMGTFSSGEKLKKVTLPKYKMLQLICQLLQLSSKTQQKDSWSPTSGFHLDLSIPFEEFDLFQPIRKYLTCTKWNNILHFTLVKLTSLILEQDYERFKKRYIDELEHPKDGFIGLVVQLFRNKKFVFLNNMKFSNYGYLNCVYEIGKILEREIKKHGHLQSLHEKFPNFDIFVSKDLKEFQKSLTSSELLDQSLIERDNSSLRETNFISCSVPAEDMSGKTVKESLKNVEQMIMKLQYSKRWIPSSWNRERKQSL